MSVLRRMLTFFLLLVFYRFRGIWTLIQEGRAVLIVA